MRVQLHVGDLVDRHNFQSVKNCPYPWIKPTSGGLWTSTYNKHIGSDWIQFCQHENFCRMNPWKGSLLYPEDNSRIFTVDSIRGLQHLIREYGIFRDNTSLFSHGIDFERLGKDYDAIHLTENGQAETRYSYPETLCGWDVESTLWLNWSFKKIRPFRWVYRS